MSKTILKRLTDPIDLDAAYKFRHQEWWNNMSYDEMHKRFNLPKDHYNEPFQMLEWALINEDDKNSPPEILSTLAIYKRASIAKVKGQPIKHINSYTIMMVVTPKDNRGKGYCGRMVTLLNKEIDKMQKEENEADCEYNFTTLWSEVGKYYEAFGFKTLPSTEFVITLTDVPQEKLAKFVPDKAITWLTEKDYASFVEEDRKQIYKDIEKATEEDGKTRVCILPETNLYTFFLSHNSHQYHLDNPDKLPKKDINGKETDIGIFDISGAKYGDSVSMMWTHGFMFGEKRLKVSRILIDSKVKDTITKAELLEALVKLLEAAVYESVKWGLGSIAIWVGDLPVYFGNSGESIVLDDIKSAWNAKHGTELNAIVQERKATVPMIRPYGDLNKDMEWFYCGYYPWR